MTTVGFFLQNASFGDANCTELQSGNPGIGGTEYEFLLVASELARRFPGEFRVVVFATAPFRHPGVLETEVVGNSPAALLRAVGAAKCDILVEDGKLPDEWFRPEAASPFRFVLWQHLDSDWRSYLAKAKAETVARVVFVGREQLDLLRDHDIYRKATFVYNVCPFDGAEVRRAAALSGDRGYRVAFVGSLTPSKGFHLVADAWPEVLRKVPDAELHVYGSGALYRKDEPLGPLGLAEAGFERRFTAPLLRPDGTIHPSVHFHGILHGRALREELAKARVGVINPNTDETFGLSAIDLLLAGCHLVVRRSPGVMDTCGYSPFSYARRSSLPGRIVAALRAEGRPSVEEAIESVERRFGPDAVLPQWRALLLDVAAGRPVWHARGLVHPFYRIKWLREINRRVRCVVPALPPIGRWQEVLPCLLRKILSAIRGPAAGRGCRR